MNEAQLKLIGLAKEVGASFSVALEKYLACALLIRESQMDPRQVSKALAAAGWARSRISEMKRLAFCSQVLFDAYRKRLIGFRPALEAARSESLTPEEKSARHLNGFKAGVARLGSAGIKLAHCEVSGLLGIAFRPETLLDGQTHKIEAGAYSVCLQITKNEKTRTDNPHPRRRAARSRRMAELQNQRD